MYLKKWVDKGKSHCSFSKHYKNLMNLLEMLLLIKIYIYIYKLIEGFFGVPCVGRGNSFDKRFPSWVAHM